MSDTAARLASEALTKIFGAAWSSVERSVIE